MASPTPSALSRVFRIDPRILGPNGSATVEVGLTTDADVINAILRNEKFPTRESGEISLGRIQLNAETGKDLVFKAGAGTVSFGASGGVRAAIGIFDNPAKAIQSLQLDAPPGMNLAADAPQGSRYLLMLWGWRASGKFSASHPIGMLGSATFGAEAKGDAVYAVLHRFPEAAGSHSVIQDTVSSWRLPRHIDLDDDGNLNMHPGTWLVAEVDGSLAIRIGAQVGYDFSLIREVKLLNLTQKLAARIDVAVKATLGFDVSGRYIIVVGRESDDAGSKTVRLRLFKQSHRGFTFGLNVTVGVKDHVPLPGKVDDLVSAIFGVHGQQVVRELQRVEQWTDPKKDPSDLIAGLTVKTGFDLLQRTTGIDPAKEFEKARGVLLGVIRKWEQLPERLSGELWGLLGQLNATAAKQFRVFLEALAQEDRKKRADALSKALKDVAFGDSPEGRFLGAIANAGLLALGDNLDHVQRSASLTLAVLEGDVLRELQKFLAEKLNLDDILKVVKETDFKKLDSWLVSKISQFLDDKFDFTKVKEVQVAINSVVTFRHKIYDQARKALANRYSIDFAATYEKATEKTALIDVEFDLAKAAALRLFRDVIAESKLDNLLTQSVAGVSLHQAELTHQITRKSSIQLQMPMFDFRSEHVNQSLAKLVAEESGGRVLVYGLDAKDTVTVRNRFKSQLSLLAGLRVRNGQIELEEKGKFISSDSRQIKENMKLVDFEHRVTPFVNEHLSHLFPGGEASLQTFYVALDRTVESAVGNGENEFGDVLLSMQVSLPGRVLESWFRRRSEAELRRASMDMSRALQKTLKQILPAYYFQEIDKLQPNPSAGALLVWATLPVSTSVKFDGSSIQLNTDRDVFWNHPDRDLRRAMASSSGTAAGLGPALALARQRLLEAGETSRAAFFKPSEAPEFQRMVLDGAGEMLLSSLLFVEAVMVEGAARALENIAKVLDNAATTPTKAIAELSEFGAALTETFHKNLTSVYGDDALRVLGPQVMLNATKAIDPLLAGIVPNAMLNITVLKEQRAFKMPDFITGSLPPPEDVALSQTLVRVAVA